MPEVVISRPFTAYKGDDPYIFVSYAHKDAQLVYPELVTLRDLGYQVWYDEGIEPGSEWPEDIANAIKNCALFIVFITPNSVNSQNVRNEINFAIDQKKEFLAIHLIETGLPDGLQLRIGSWQAILKYHQMQESYLRKLTGVLSDRLKKEAHQEQVVDTTTTLVDKRKPNRKPNLSSFAAGSVLLLSLLIWGGINLFSPTKGANPDLAIQQPTLVEITTKDTQITTQSPSPQKDLSSSSIPTTQKITPKLDISWVRFNSADFFNRDSITTALIDPEDPLVIYAGTQFSGLYKTTDGGASWQPIHGGLINPQIRALAIDPSTHLTLYAVTDGGVYKSLDGGTTWKSINSDLTTQFSEGTARLWVDPSQPEQIILGYSAGVFRTSDGGESWQAAYQGDCPMINQTLAIDAALKDTWYTLHSAEGSDCSPGLYKTGDGGQSWQLINNSVLSDFLYNPLQIENSPDSESYVYTLDVNQALIISADGGNTWHNSNVLGCASLNSDPQGRVLALCSAKLYLFSEGRLQAKLTDTLDRNFQIYSVPSDARQFLFTSINADPTSDGKNVFITTDGGVTFVARNNGLGLSCSQLKINPYYSDAYYLLSACGQSSFASYSLDAGLTWQIYKRFKGTNGIQFNHLEFDSDQKNIYASSPDSPRLWSSMVQADNWVDKTNPSKYSADSKEGKFFADPYQASTIYHLGNDENNQPVLLRSSDRGITWDESNILLPFEFPLDQGALYFDALDGRTRYLLSSQEMAFSTDHGETWESCGLIPRTGKGTSLLAIDPVQPQTLYLATREQGVVVSQDGCKTWSIPQTEISSQAVNALMFDPEDAEVLYAGANTGIYVSVDQGQSWWQYNEGLLNHPIIYSLAVQKQTATMYATTPYGLFKMEKN